MSCEEQTKPNNIFYIVDAFSQTKNSGNPLAVRIDADNLSDDEM